MKNLWAPWRMTYITGDDNQAATGSCIFCLKGDHPAPDKERFVLYVGPLSMVMMNRYPYTNGHLLVAPRRHVAELADLDKEELGDLLDLVRTSIEIIRQDMNPDGFNVGLNIGQVAGAGVEDHIHFHIVPRWNGDTNFMTVFADVRVIPEHLEATFGRLAKFFMALPKK
ncbi:MAG: HIT domain-containing protein [Deltaproteobacteria bacterium]|nr:HIT domain-containing protein [Deltaproteobacteria bacterium]